MLCSVQGQSTHDSESSSDLGVSTRMCERLVLILVISAPMLWTIMKAGNLEEEAHQNMDLERSEISDVDVNHTRHMGSLQGAGTR